MTNANISPETRRRVLHHVLQALNAANGTPTQFDADGYPVQRAAGVAKYGLTVKRGRHQLVTVTYRASGVSDVVPMSPWLEHEPMVRFIADRTDVLIINDDELTAAPRERVHVDLDDESLQVGGLTGD